MGDAKVTRGNPIIKAPIPSNVGRPLPEQLPKVKKEDKELGIAGVGEEEKVVVSPEKEVARDVVVDANPKGTINIRVFENSPYEVEFDGVIAGFELDMAWRAMMKEYRVWKHTMFKKIEQEKKDGGE